MNTDLHRMLVCTDFSAPARHALERGAQLAQVLAAELSVLHVLDRGQLSVLHDWLAGDADGVTRALAQEADEAMSALLAEVQGQHPGVHLDAQVLMGDALTVIAEQLVQGRQDLLVVGARGRDFMRHWTLGSTTERLMRLVDRPILTVKQGVRASYQRVLVAVDFSDWSLASVRLARQLAPTADLVLLHAFELPYEGKLRFAGVDEGQVQLYRDQMRYEAQTRLAALAEQAGLVTGSWVPLVVNGYAPAHVLEQEEEQDVDLIVLGKHGQGMIESLLLGSTTKHVLSASRCDVLVTQRS